MKPYLMKTFFQVIGKTAKTLRNLSKVEILKFVMVETTICNI
ncbi:MAG: hypothetical protein RSB70_05770 [Clostridium sp.]